MTPCFRARGWCSRSSGSSSSWTPPSGPWRSSPMCCWRSWTDLSLGILHVSSLLLNTYPGDPILNYMPFEFVISYISGIFFGWMTNSRVFHQFSRLQTLEGISSSLWRWQAITSEERVLMMRFKIILFWIQSELTSTLWWQFQWHTVTGFLT